MNPTFEKTSFRNLFRRGQLRTGGAESGRAAHRDWRIILITFFALNVALLAVSGYIFHQINNGEIFLVNKSESSDRQTLDRFELEKTIALFEEKREQFDSLMHKSLETKDPFIPSIGEKK